jgi:multiple sugar transport system permease protein
MTNGGPDNATLFYMLHLYNNAFRFFKMGYASAMAWVLFLAIVLFTILQFRLSRLWVYTEEA